MLLLPVQLPQQEEQGQVPGGALGPAGEDPPQQAREVGALGSLEGHEFVGTQLS